MKIGHQQTRMKRVVGQGDAAKTEGRDRAPGGGRLTRFGGSVVRRLYDGAMEKTTSRKLARKRLLEAQLEAAAAREARERANLSDLTEFTVRLAEVDAVDDWLAGRIEKVKSEAAVKRQAHRRAAGKALHAMRLRGETMASISALTGLSVSRLRELMKSSVEDSAGGAVEPERPAALVVPLPNRGPSDAGDTAPPGAAVVAH